MRNYRIRKIEHTVFDSIDELPDDFVYLRNWRDGIIGDWVLADDGAVLQILRKGKMMKARGADRCVHYIGTCTGTFIVSDKKKLDSSKRVNIYSIGGDLERNERVEKRQTLSGKEALFVQYVSKGMDPKKAYLEAFPTNDPHYAGMKATKLMKTTRILSSMKEELKPHMEELGIDEGYILREIKGVIDKEEAKDDTKLKALFKLADIMDMEDKNKTQVTQLTGAVFKGFSDDTLEAAERPKEIGNG
jgi:hypothetical protein